MTKKKDSMGMSKFNIKELINYRLVIIYQYQYQYQYRMIKIKLKKLIKKYSRRTSHII